MFGLTTLALTCNNAFEGGGWALVRRVKKGNVWFAATDNLRGTAEYGLQNSRITDDSSFSILYSTNVWTGTEFLFMIGMTNECARISHTLICTLCLQGTGNKFLITNWDAITFNGASYSGLDRRITKSSASSSACMERCLLTTMYRCSSCCVDTTRWWNSKNDASHPAIFMYALET